MSDVTVSKIRDRWVFCKEGVNFALDETQRQQMIELLIPDNMVLVPREPTECMVKAFCGHSSVAPFFFKLQYADMIQAWEKENET